jgi:hypothetical protein
MVEIIYGQLNLYSTKMTTPIQSFKDYSLHELVDLLVAKTTALIESHEKKAEGIDFQKTLLEIEQIQAEIKIKKQESSN